jgi:hypothetical protein
MGKPQRLEYRSASDLLPAEAAEKPAANLPGRRATNTAVLNWGFGRQQET